MNQSIGMPYALLYIVVDAVQWMFCCMTNVPCTFHLLKGVDTQCASRIGILWSVRHSCIDLCLVAKRGDILLLSMTVIEAILHPEMFPGSSKASCTPCISEHTQCLCRDRADERRRGITVEESAPSYLTAEETRYLGGSMERTHLVRGLDRLLLNQVRDKVSDRAEQAVEAPSAAAEPDSEEKASDVPSTFQTSLGRAVGTYLLKPPAANIAELFQPKRMAFVYFADTKGSDDEEEEAEEDDEEQDGGVCSAIQHMLSIWGVATLSTVLEVGCTLRALSKRNQLNEGQLPQHPDLHSLQQQYRWAAQRCSSWGHTHWVLKVTFLGI